ncbi:PH domain-containing protein [Saccharopolyspora taberi]|uniref:PH domain-containing protein n=1 Tax=Saccharopolyspora taberi TaxID=60895 RepID=A0ABN3VKS6_9PSEU
MTSPQGDRPAMPDGPAVAGTGDDGWQRLDSRTIFATAVLVLAPLIPTVAIMLLSGAGMTPLLITAGIWLAIAVLLSAGAGYEWSVTRYRVTSERVELRKGTLSRSHRWIPRDRIRSVDLTADPVHRVLGLSVVKIGTGQSGGDDADLKLDAIPKADAEALRHELLHSPQPGTAGTAEQAPPADGVLAVLKPAWLGYGALTVSLAAIVWGAIGSAFGSFRELLEAYNVFAIIGEWLKDVPLWLTITGGAIAAVISGMVGALALSVEMWWGFHLTRERDTTLRVRRGLLTTRSVSLEERRMRGVEVAEPLVLRWARGARTNAVATGLQESKDGKHTESKALLPPAPRAEAQRVAALVLREPEPPTNGALRGHPRVALRRRVTWGIAATVPFIAAAVVSAALGWIPMWTIAVVTVVGVAIAIAAGFDAYRSLGHQVSPKYLIMRRGTGIRRTVALQRTGIIGWRVKQSLFQRRSGLVTVSAITAAGAGAYKIPDVSAGEGLAVAEHAVPGLLQPFLEREVSRV